MPYFPVGTNSGLSVAPGESLRLIGGSVNIEGGVLSAPGGNVSVGSVQAGIVSLKKPTLDYRDVEKFGDISLTERSLVEVGGIIAGSVQLQGRNILLSDGSLIWSQNRGLAAAGEISVSATEQLLITGTTPSVEATSGIISETLAPGNAGNLNITAPQLTVQAGATLLSRSFGSGDTGHLRITTEQTVISGYAPTAPNVFSAAATVTFLSGSGNDVVVSAQNLSITEGGYLGASTFGSGQGGNVQITSNTIEVIGATPASIGSNIGANTAGLGNSGNVVLRTGTLNLQDNGLVNTASAAGNAGNILIDASERIDISGGRPNLPTSRIASTVNFPPLGLQVLLGLSGTPRGSSGDIVIHTPILNIRALGTVTVANFAEGSAGQLTIHANSVVVEQGAIDAFTKAGDGGNITLNIRDILLLRAGDINATARGSGNGGNLRINSPIIIGLENSDITASATTGNGGNIDITAQAIFGLTPRAQQTAESDITASSQFGLNGTVSVNGLAVRPEVVLVELSEELSDPNTQVSKSCTASQRNQFIVSGRGGLPPAPRDGLVLTDPWEDLRAIAPTSNHATIDPAKLTPAPPKPATLLEASGWQTDAAGQVILTATASEPRQIDSGNCLTQARLHE